MSDVVSLTSRNHLFSSLLPTIFLSSFFLFQPVCLLFLLHLPPIFLFFLYMCFIFPSSVLSFPFLPCAVYELTHFLFSSVLFIHVPLLISSPVFFFFLSFSSIFAFCLFILFSRQKKRGKNPLFFCPNYAPILPFPAFF